MGGQEQKDQTQGTRERGKSFSCTNIELENVTVNWKKRGLRAEKA